MQTRESLGLEEKGPLEEVLEAGRGSDLLERK